MIRLITFDFWNTLFVDRGENIRSEIRKEFALDRLRKYKKELEKSHLEVAFQVAQDEFELQWQRYTSSTMDSYVMTIVRELGLECDPCDHREIVDFFETILLQHQPEAISSAVDAVHSAKLNFKLGLISDTGFSPGSTLRQILNSHGIGPCFDSFSFSNETGFLKPRLEAYLRIFHDLNIRPSEAVHIGDLEHTDIAGAKRLGMKAIKYIGTNRIATRESIADAVIDDLSELPAALERLQYNKNGN